MSLDADTLNEIASELGVDVSFIEKDWYACQALKADPGSEFLDDFSIEMQ